MNAKALVVVLVAIFAIAGFLLLRSGGDSAPLAPGQVPGQPTPASAPGKVDLAQARVAPDAAGAATADKLERMAVPAAADGRSDGAIAVRGRIVDRAGAPRGGVELAMHGYPGFDGAETAVLPPPRGGREVSRADQPKCTTRADGTFQLPLAKGHAGAIELVTERLVFAAGDPGVDGKKGDQDLGDITVLQEARVSGIVKDQRGQPVADVKVAATLGALGFGSGSSSMTAKDGTFSLGMLRPGNWTLRTASGRFLPVVQELELAAEEQRADVVLVVKPGNAIAGQVVDDRGVGVKDMKVGSRRKEAKGGVAIERFASDEATTTDANGYFTLSGLADEPAAVRAFGPGHSSATVPDVPVGTGNLVLRVERLGTVEGVLVGADGAPIAGSHIQAQAASTAGEGFLLDALDIDPIRNGAETAADGSFTLASVKPGVVTVSARGKAHRPVSQGNVNVLPAQTTKGIRLVADLGATARVKVTAEGGKAVAGAKVTARRASQAPLGGPGQMVSRSVRVEDHGDGPMPVAGDDAVGSATSDAEGVATITGLPAGDLQFVAKHEQFAASAPARAVTPKTGSIDVALQLRTPGIAEIVVFGTDGTPQPGVELQIQPTEDGGAAAGDGESKRVTSGEGGVVRVASLVPGNYTAALVRAATPASIGNAMVFLGNSTETLASSQQRFTVVAGQVVRVEVRRPVLARLHGVVTGTDGPAAGCVVQLASTEEGRVEIPGFGGRNATTGVDGGFAFDDVEPGRYVLEYGKRDQVVKGRHELEVPANTPDVRQDLALRTGKLKVKVVAKGTGEPVDKAEVEIVRAEAAAASGAPRQERRVMMVSVSMTNDGNGDAADSTTMTMGAQRTHTDEDGVAEIDDIPVGEYTLRIKHRKHAPAELKGQSVVERQTTDCGRVELDAAGLIRGKVVAADGKPVRMALVASRAVGTEQWSEPVMAQGGSYRIQGLAAGKYRVRANALGAAETYSPEVEVEVKTGETANADLQLPASGN